MNRSFYISGRPMGIRNYPPSIGDKVKFSETYKNSLLSDIEGMKSLRGEIEKEFMIGSEYWVGVIWDTTNKEIKNQTSHKLSEITHA